MRSRGPPDSASLFPLTTSPVLGQLRTEGHRKASLAVLRPAESELPAARPGFPEGAPAVSSQRAGAMGLGAQTSRCYSAAERAHDPKVACHGMCRSSER